MYVKDRDGNGISRDGGYFTLEAAMIASMVCFLVLGIIITALYHYDLGVASSLLKKAVFEQAMGADLDAKEKNRYREELENQLVIAGVRAFSLEETLLSMKGEAELTVEFPVPLIDEWIGNSWKKQISYQMERGNTADKIRRWSLIE